MSFIFSDSQEEKENKIDIASEDDFVIEKKMKAHYGMKYRKLKKNSTNTTICKLEPIIELGCKLKKEKLQHVIKSSQIQCKSFNQEEILTPSSPPMNENIEEVNSCDKVVQKIASDVIESFELHFSSQASPSNMIDKEQDNITLASSMSHSKKVQPCATVSQAQTPTTAAGLSISDQFPGSDCQEENLMTPGRPPALSVLMPAENTADGQDKGGCDSTKYLPQLANPKQVISQYKDMLSNLMKISLIEEEMIESNKSKWHCLCCDKKWVVSKSTAKKHMESHLPLKECQLCEKKFKTRESFFVHMKNVHNNNIKSLFSPTPNLVSLSSNFSNTSSMLPSKSIQLSEESEENYTPDSKAEIDHNYNLDVSTPVRIATPEQINSRSILIEKRYKLTKLVRFLPQSTFFRTASSGMTRTSRATGGSFLGVRSPKFYRPGLTRQSAPCSVKPGSSKPLYRPGCPRSRHPSTSGLKLSNVGSITTSVKQATPSLSSHCYPPVICLDSSYPYQDQYCSSPSPGTLYQSSFPGVTVAKTNFPEPPQGLIVDTTPLRKEGFSLSLSTLSTALRHLGEGEGRKRVVKFELTQEQIIGFELLGVREELL